MDDDVNFVQMVEGGEVISQRRIPRAAIKACPHVIMVPEHYREDGSCRCNDPSHTEMLEWEYQWNGQAWT